MASTYPLEVVQADRWVKENKNLKGDQLKAAVDKQPWDDSVKSLVATPYVLAMMSSKLDWTQKLGDAVLAQQPDVMDAIQRLRTKADANNKLTSTKEQKVTKQQEGGKQVIVIEPTDPETVYVPYYDPAVVYGAWPYPDYPPYAFGWPGYIAGGLIATGLAFGAGYALGRWASGGNFWGGGVNWGNNNININRPRVNPLGGNNWQHNPAHRHGVRYNNSNVQQRFGGNRGGAQNRMDFRGRGGEQVLRPGGERPGAGQAWRRRSSWRGTAAWRRRAAWRGTTAWRQRGQGSATAFARRTQGSTAAVRRPRERQRAGNVGSGRAAAVARGAWSHELGGGFRGGGGGGGGRWRRRRRRWRPWWRWRGRGGGGRRDPTSRSSTTSSCSGISPTASATIASAITAAIVPMSA